MKEKDILPTVLNILIEAKLEYAKFSANCRLHMGYADRLTSQELEALHSRIPSGLCSILGTMTARKEVTAKQANKTLAQVREHLEANDHHKHLVGYWWPPKDYDSRIKCITKILKQGIEHGKNGSARRQEFNV